MNNSEKANLVSHKLNNAKKTIIEAELLINHKMWNAAVNRIYYACFYAVSALLANSEVHSHFLFHC